MLQEYVHGGVAPRASSCVMCCHYKYAGNGFACGVIFLSFLMIRKLHYQGGVLGQQLCVDVAIY